MKKKKGVIYARVSTTKDEQKSSLEIQEESLSNICKQKNIEIVNTYTDTASGTRIRKRKGFINMLYDAGIDFKKCDDKSTDDFKINKNRKPLFDYIICKDVFRFGRNSIEAVSVIKELKNNGIIVYFINAGFDTSDKDYKLRLELLFTIAENESHNTSQRIKFSKRHLAKSGHYAPSRLPYGYKRIVNEHGKKEIVKDDEQAKIVKFIFEKYHENGGHVLSNLLNEKGIKTQQGHQWTNDKITRIINNTAYYGCPIVQKWTKNDVTDMYFHKTEKEHQIQLINVIPSIISKEQFESVQDIKKKRTNSNSNSGKYIGKEDVFYEKIYCMKCGSRFVRHTGYNNKVNYMCQKRRKFGAKSCDCKGIAYNTLMKFINQSEVEINALRHGGQLIQLKKNIDNALMERNEVINDIQQKITLLDRKINNIIDSFIDASPTMRNNLNVKMEQCESDKIILKNQLEQLSINSIEKLKNDISQKELMINKMYKKSNFTFEEKMQMLKEIKVGTDYIEVIYMSPDYDDEIEKFNEIFGGTNLEMKLSKPTYRSKRYYRNTTESIKDIKR